MKKRHLFYISANFLSVLFLIALIFAPFYLAAKSTEVAGAKSKASFLLVSQVEKFPNIKLEQESDKYRLFFTTYAENTLFTSVLIINNPTQSGEKYKILTVKGNSKLFFGETIDDVRSLVEIPPNTSVPISLLVTGQEENQIEFRIEAF